MSTWWRHTLKSELPCRGLAEPRQLHPCSARPNRPHVISRHNVPPPDFSRLLLLSTSPLTRVQVAIARPFLLPFPFCFAREIVHRVVFFSSPYRYPSAVGIAWLHISLAHHCSTPLGLLVLYYPPLPSGHLSLRRRCILSGSAGRLLLVT